ATHHTATASGQPRRYISSRWATLSTAKTSASATASATQAYQARLVSQESSGRKKASPNTSPSGKAARRLRPRRMSARTAGPTGASAQTPRGENEAARGTPPATAPSGAIRGETRTRRDRYGRDGIRGLRGAAGPGAGPPVSPLASPSVLVSATAPPDQSQRACCFERSRT